MKNFLTLSLLLFTLVLNAQTGDGHWDVYQVSDGVTAYKNINGTYTITPPPAVSPFSNILIAREEASGPDFTEDGIISIPRNDFFIIYNDGSYFNSKNYNTWPHPGNALSVNSVMENTYYVEAPSGKTIKYLYLTNVYGSEDPDAYIVPNPVPTSYTSLPSIPINQAQGTSNSPISVNHDLVRSNDITLILTNEGRKPDDDSGCFAGTFSICFDKLSNNSSIANQELLDVSNVFEGNFHLNLDGPISFDLENQCINNIQLNSQFGYINLQVKDPIDDALRNKELSFNVIKEGESVPCTHLDVKILDSHDPNFIQVMCIAKKGNERYVKYKIQCTNDEITPTPGNLELSFAPPNNVYLPLDITHTNALINSSPAPSVTQTTVPSLNPVTGPFVPSYEKFDLGTFLNANATASIEVCVRMSDGLDLEDISATNLQPDIPRTHFGKQIWSINHFYDLCDSMAYDGELNAFYSVPILANPNTPGEDCRREYTDNFKDCINCKRDQDCPCRWYSPRCCLELPWFWPLVFIILTGFIFAFLMRRSNRRKLLSSDDNKDQNH